MLLRIDNRSVAALVVVAGCGRIGFTSVGDGAATGDSPVMGIVLVGELSEAGVDIDDPALTPDLLEIFYRRTVMGQEADLYTATRTSASLPFSGARPLVELNSAFGDGAPEISADGLTIYFSSSRAAPPSHDIWMATRPTRGDMWSTPVAVGQLNSTGYDIPGGVDDASLRIVIARFPGTNADLMESTRALPTDPWGQPLAIAEVNSVNEEGVPFLDRTGTKLYFASDRPGLGGRDLWFSERPTPASPFVAPTPLSELSSSGSDEDPWASLDGSVLYFASNRAGGRLEIYQAIR